MSVWATIWTAEDDPGDGEPGPPILYQASHILPADTDPRGSSVSLAEVPGHITRDGRDDGPDDEFGVWPWLRLSVGAEDVVLDEQLVRGLHEALGGWLDARDTLPPSGGLTPDTAVTDGPAGPAPERLHP